MDDPSEFIEPDDPDDEPTKKAPSGPELAFKRELFMRLYQNPSMVNNAGFCWMLVQRAWGAKPEDC